MMITDFVWHTGPERGTCVCDDATQQSMCHCRTGYKGFACECSTRNDACIASNGVGQENFAFIARTFISLNYHDRHRHTERVSFGGGGGLKSLARIFSPWLARKSSRFARILLAFCPKIAV